MNMHVRGNQIRASLEELVVTISDRSICFSAATGNQYGTKYNNSDNCDYHIRFHIIENRVLELIPAGAQ
jgi:hypothetical protein